MKTYLSDLLNIKKNISFDFQFSYFSLSFVDFHEKQINFPCIPLGTYEGGAE